MEKTEIYRILNDAYFGKEMDEKQEIDDLPLLLEGCEIFVDVGASIGQYTYFANQILNNAVIYSIEADPLRFEMLEQNCKAWEKLGTNKIIPINAIVAEKEGMNSFYSTESNVSGSVFKIPQRSEHWKKLDVKSITLDKFVEKEKNIFVKIDIEGGEYRALSGSKKLMEESNATFLVELHAWGDKDLRKYPHHIIKLFYQSSYEMSKRYNHYLFKKSARKKKLPFRYYYLFLKRLFESCFPFSHQLIGMTKKDCM